MNQREHKETAEALLAEAREVGAKLRSINEIRKKTINDCQDSIELQLAQGQIVDMTRMMDEQGKKAMGIYAQAQVHATLATVPDWMVGLGPKSALVRTSSELT